MFPTGLDVAMVLFVILLVVVIPTAIMLLILYFIIKGAVRNGVKQAYSEIKSIESLNTWRQDAWQ